MLTSTGFSRHFIGTGLKSFVVVPRSPGLGPAVLERFTCFRALTGVCIESVKSGIETVEAAGEGGVSHLNVKCF